MNLHYGNKVSAVFFSTLGINLVLFCFLFDIDYFLWYFRTEDDIEKFRESKSITIKGDRIPPPIMRFEDVNFPDYVMNEVK